MDRQGNVRKRKRDLLSYTPGNEKSDKVARGTKKLKFKKRAEEAAVTRKTNQVGGNIITSERRREIGELLNIKNQRGTGLQSVVTDPSV